VRPVRSWKVATLATLLAVAGDGPARAGGIPYVGGIFTVAGLPGITAMSIRQHDTALHMCLTNGIDIVNTADGTFDPTTRAFTLSWVPSALGPGGLGAYCSIEIGGTFAPDGASFTATQVEHSTCVPPPFSCVPQCVLSATIPFSGTRVSTTPASPCCGDDIAEGGEQCDDGNDAAGDCCAPDCTAEPDGGTCPNDGDVCTSETCQAGICLHPDSCTHQGVTGTKLILKRAGSREKLVWLAKDPSFAMPAIGGPDDPTTAGASLELFAPLEDDVSMPIPPGAGNPGWTAGTGATQRLRFRNGQAPLGASPVRVATLKDGKTLKVVAKDAGFPMTQPLFGSASGWSRARWPPARSSPPEPRW